MKQNFFDVFAIKDYETNQTGQLEKKTAWNKIGSAWFSKSGEAMNFELYLLPGQRYVIQFKAPKKQEPESTEQAPF